MMFRGRASARVVAAGLCAVLAFGACNRGDDDPEETDDDRADETVSFDIELSGKNIGPEAGDDDGSGSGTLSIDPSTGKVCTELTTSGIGEIVAVHLQRGSVATSGPIVLPLPPPQNGAIDACVDGDPAAMKAVTDAPGEYFVNVRTRELPGGAIRAPLDAEAASKTTARPTGPKSSTTAP